MLTLFAYGVFIVAGMGTLVVVAYLLVLDTIEKQVRKAVEAVNRGDE